MKLNENVGKVSNARNQTIEWDKKKPNRWNHEFSFMWLANLFASIFRFKLHRIENGVTTETDWYVASGSEFLLQIIGDLSVSMAQHQRMLKG